MPQRSLEDSVPASFDQTSRTRADVAARGVRDIIRARRPFNRAIPAVDNPVLLGSSSDA